MSFFSGVAVCVGCAGTQELSGQVYWLYTYLKIARDNYQCSSCRAGLQHHQRASFFFNSVCPWSVCTHSCWNTCLWCCSTHFRIIYSFQSAESECCRAFERRWNRWNIPLHALKKERASEREHFHWHICVIHCLWDISLKEWLAILFLWVAHGSELEEWDFCWNLQMAR